MPHAKLYKWNEKRSELNRKLSGEKIIVLGLNANNSWMVNTKREWVSQLIDRTKNQWSVFNIESIRFHCNCSFVFVFFSFSIFFSSFYEYLDVIVVFCDYFQFSLICCEGNISAFYKYTYMRRIDRLMSVSFSVSGCCCCCFSLIRMNMHWLNERGLWNWSIWWIWVGRGMCYFGWCGRCQFGEGFLWSIRL